MKVVWSEPARRLLQQRDRFTQQAIADEFQNTIGNDSLTDSVEFDAAKKGYLTPVAESRYSVVWYHDEPGSTAVVRAVVPWTRFSKDSGNLKDRVQQIVNVESRGAVQVD